jgi:hypothetical protein
MMAVNAMPDRQTLPIDGTSGASSDWPTLVERVVDDVARILRSEAQMFQTNLGAALELQINSTLTRLTIVALIIGGAICILFASILLLHEWLPWWQAFGIVGITIFLAGITMNAKMRRRS